MERGRGPGGWGEVFTRAAAQHLIPRTNPFLRDFFYQITGPQLESEPFAGFVEDLVQLLAHADMGAILADFGRRTRQQDPTVHFYETFLAAYDPALREKRGVFYTPDPVVSFIVRSVDLLLKTRFGLPQGLADTTKVTPPLIPPLVGGQREVHKVLILDPATGTATFPYAIIDHIRAQFMAQGNAGMWSGYVREHLLPRIFGFELLMAPYAVAHFKLALQLAGYDLDPEQRAAWAYDFGSDERIGIYLTNALEGPHEHTGLPLFTQFLADESAAANEIKRDAPIMVIVGNPPYAVSSSNQGPHIEALMALYKTAVRSERNIQPLSDDYIKFIRFAHDRIERTGYGILGFITNHSYLAGLIHRGMREELLKSFDEIYILNLHGNALMGETAPDGGKDENVFDIRQGVAIALMVKAPHLSHPPVPSPKFGEGEKSPVSVPPLPFPLPVGGLRGVERGLGGEVKYADLWGNRESKYRVLNENDVTTLSWETLQPVAPHYFFVPKDFELEGEYKQAWDTSQIFSNYSTGFVTGRDDQLISHTRDTLASVFRALADNNITDEEIERRFGLTDTSGWPVSRRRQELIKEGFQEDFITSVSYRPFDERYTYYHQFLQRARFENLRHLCRTNLALITSRIIKGEEPRHVFVSTGPVEKIFLSPKTSNNAYIFLLYLYPDETTATLLDATAMSPWPPDPAHGNRVPNLAPEFVKAVEEKLGLRFQPHPPAPSPNLGEGEEEGRGARSAPAQLWAKLKPLARQMRHEPTEAEDALWQQVRNRKVAGVKFRRQHAIERFIVDFYAAEPGLIIEVDGPIHDYTQAEDAVRQAYLESQGLHVLRFTNDQVLQNLEEVLAEIARHLTAKAERQPHPPAPSLKLREGEQTSPPSPLRSLERGRGPGGWGEVFTPEDLLAYLYALLHSPTYRARYAEFLKIDFPRVPLTADVALFWRLVALGRDLIALHLLESPPLQEMERGQGVRYPVPGDNLVEKGYPQYTPPNPAQAIGGRVHINAAQYFEGVPEAVWEFQIGGYQVLHKWLKDRRGRRLTFDDLMHYQQIVVALQETLRLMAEIDAAIPEWPIVC